jgi:ketosteroid isomerase-like protein
MSQENVEWVRAAHRAWNEGGPAALAETFWHPEIVWHEPPETPGAGVYRGRQEVLRYFEQFMDVMGKLRIEEEDVIAADDSLAVAVVRLVGTAPSSGVPVELPVTHVYRLDTDHRAVEVRAYLDPQQALEAVGLAE